MTKILMCPPDYFDIEYSINPWMNTSIKVDSSKTDQWNNLKATFTNLNHEVKLIEPVDGLPDMVYVDAGILYKNTFIPSNFKYKERQGESIYFAKWFEDNGFEVLTIDPIYNFEGHGDTLVVGDKIFFGYGFRSSVEAMFEAKKLLPSVEIIPVELTDERFYHLDTCFCPLGDNKALVFKDALSKKALDLLESHLELIEIPEDDATKFACNSVVLGKDILIPEGATATNQKLNDLGYTVHQIPMTEYIKGGGACKCLSMILD
jgi:N-dimethylarginine dimethylaminohydrolase